jgi:hypothetical protein
MDETTTIETGLGWITNPIKEIITARCYLKARKSGNLLDFIVDDRMVAGTRTRFSKRAKIGL